MASLSEEILCRAIRTEIRARNFYARLSAQIQNRRGHRRMHALSRSEEHHRRMLVRRFRSLLGREYSLSEDQHGTADMGAEDPSSLGEQVFAGQASALDVVSFAIGMEDRAARYYSERLQEVDDRRDVRMLRRLVHFETRHKDRMQAEYARLNSRASKITYSHHTNWWG